MASVIVLALLAHALAHVAGFVVPWHLGPVEGIPARTTILGGVVDIGPVGARVLGILWLLTAIAVAAAAAALLLRAPWWSRAALAVLAWSAVLCIIAWPDARPGLIVNAALGGAILAGSRLGWLAVGG